MYPNSTAALFDSNDDILYIKSTDGAGFPTIRTFRFSEVTMDAKPEAYVTRKEFDELKEMLSHGKFTIPDQSEQ